MKIDEGTTMDTAKRIVELEAQLEPLEEQMINLKAEEERTIENCIQLMRELESEESKWREQRWKAKLDKRNLDLDPDLKGKQILGLSSKDMEAKREHMEKMIRNATEAWGALKRKNTELFYRVYPLREQKREIEDEIVGKIGVGVSNCTSLALAVSYPATAVAPHMFINAYNNALAVAVATDYSFPRADWVKEYLADPAKFAVEEKKEESSDDESYYDFGFPLYDTPDYDDSAPYRGKKEEA